MAFDFNANGYIRATTGSAPGADYPFTVSFWFWSDSDGYYGCWSSQNSASGAWNDRFSTLLRYTTMKLEFTVTKTGGGSYVASPSNTYGHGAWHHALGIYASSTDRTAVLDGDWASRGTSTVAATVSGIDYMMIGCSNYGGTYKIKGNVAECAVWSIALGQSEAEQLASGVSPALVRPDKLGPHVPLIRDKRVLRANGVGAFADVGTAPTVAAHPPIIRPRRPSIGHEAYVAPTGMLFTNPGMDARTNRPQLTGGLSA